MKTFINFLGLALAIVSAFFSTTSANAQMFIASAQLNPEQVVNYAVQNYNTVNFTIATNETADNKIMPVTTWATGSLNKTNGACKSLKSPSVTRYWTQSNYTDQLFDDQDAIIVSLYGTGCNGQASIKKGNSEMPITFIGAIKGLPGADGKDTYLLYGTYGNGRSFVTISLFNYVPVP